MEFKKESLEKAKQELKNVNDDVKKIMEKIYMYLKDLHNESQVAPNKQLVDIGHM